MRTSKKKSEARINLCLVWIPGSRGKIASSDLKQPEWWKWSTRSASGKKSFEYPSKYVPQTRIYLWLRFSLEHAKVWWHRLNLMRTWPNIKDKTRGKNLLVLWIPGSRGTIASSDIQQPESDGTEDNNQGRKQCTGEINPFSALRKMFHQQGFTYD